jgi:2-dehydro-3-deoxyphosphooctonate aldolase (KDO 8-P synthase)
MNIIMGPCVIDDKLDECAAFVAKLSVLYPELNFIFKASWDKANRTDINSYRGPAKTTLARYEIGLSALAEVKKKYGLQVITDIHESWQVAAIADFVDYIQIPAMLSRQTDLLVAAGETKLPVMIKMMTTMNLTQMQMAMEKIPHNKVIACYRGTAFGDRNIFDCETVYAMAQRFTTYVDVTHTNNGIRDLTCMYTGACLPFVQGIFAEIYPTPQTALSDGKYSLDFVQAEQLIQAISNFLGDK